ncbi:uncharacterized protein J3D65DRAFT_611347 [Phyllosticta citribraziliensis]|uniref:NmrA-like domain-containing protein n=1 Tax=Phyllosticta citribraziliensis TaxID=989973 RepID=A0ABR1MBZ3_9PEZI
MANIEHLVLISVIGADQDFPSASVAQESKAIEHRLQNEALHWTILRDSQYSETISDASGPRVLQMKICICNIGDGQVGFVCREDSAACAAVILKDPEIHRQRIYHLTGPELLSIRDVLDMLEDLEGLERGAIRYGKVTDDQMADFLDKFGIPRQRDLPGSSYCGIFTIPDMISFGRACRLGEMAMKTNDVELLTGNAPQSMREVFWRRRSWRKDFPWMIKDLEADLARSEIS